MRPLRALLRLGGVEPRPASDARRDRRRGYSDGSISLGRQDLSKKAGKGL